MLDALYLFLYLVPRRYRSARKFLPQYAQLFICHEKEALDLGDGTILQRSNAASSFHSSNPLDMA
jgi:hypothetical protein